MNSSMSALALKSAPRAASPLSSYTPRSSLRNTNTRTPTAAPRSQPRADAIHA